VSKEGVIEMDLRQLRYAIAVADELSFTRAAERCHISQPPLSRAIRELEEEIGARLFERDKHSVALTAAGRGFIENTRKIFSLLGDATSSAQRTASGLGGTLTFGFGGSTVYSLLPALVASFRLKALDVDIRFRAMPVLSQIEAVRSGEIDIGVVRLPVFDEVLATRFIYAEPLIVALPTGHPLLVDSGAVSIDRLVNFPFVTYEPTRGFNFHADLLALCRLANFSPYLAHLAPTTEAVVGIVACGEGVAVLPASAERLRMRGVSFRTLAAPMAPPRLTRVRFGLAWHEERETATTRQFIDHASTMAQEDPDDQTEDG